jgi:hypothetical protein
MTHRSTDVHGSCPPWCVVAHDAEDREPVHISGELLVRRTVLRLCAGIDALAGTVAGPYVLIGDEEFTLHEAEALLSALTQLLEDAQAALTPGLTPGAGDAARSPGP